MKIMWKLVLSLLVVVAVTPLLHADDVLLKNAYQQRLSDIQLRGSGELIKLLPQDNVGSRHQKFILKLNSGQTLLISHNIDLAPKIESIKIGDWVEFYGEYEWNSQGGVVHWTHRDPDGRHAHGWLKHKGKKYQ
ncbi:Protein of unknown function [Alteromonadaceae bacterium Bs31]|nr:Protein of unknown function [Alteromonadaceae bacterium Bs31]